MAATRQVKLFRNGRNQALRIPREFELPGRTAVIRKEGEKLIIEPSRKKQTLLDVLAAMDAVGEQLPTVPELPHEPVDL